MVRSCTPTRANEKRRIMGRGLGLEKNKKRIEVEMPTKTREGCVCR